MPNVPKLPHYTIVVSNDDGYQAPGLCQLVAALRQLAPVLVVAPDRDRSGASNSLSLKVPVHLTPHAEQWYSVDGTPTDCVHLALTALSEQPVDLVVSGINAGANLGEDVLYSGTVAAAMEGRLLGVPAIAISLTARPGQHFETAARVAQQLVLRIAEQPLPADTLLNVNVPDIAWDDLKGFQVTRLGHRHHSEPAIKATTPRGDPIYWIGPAGPEQDAGPGTDFHAIRQGYVSVTPLQVDLTRHSTLATLNDWFAPLAR